MPTVQIRPELLDEIRQLGGLEKREQADPLADLVEEALQAYLFRLRQRKIEQEREAYRRRHAEFLRRYRHRFVAVHQGEVVGVDEDRDRLLRQVRERFGKIPVAVIYVDDSPEPDVFTVYSPRLIDKDHV